MVRQIITINVGKCGINLGYNVWKQYCIEHNINKNGVRKSKNNNTDSSFLSFFEETKNGKKYEPLNIMIDLEPDVIDKIKQSNYSKLLNPLYLLNGNKMHQIILLQDIIRWEKK